MVNTLNMIHYDDNNKEISIEASQNIVSKTIWQKQKDEISNTISLGGEIIQYAKISEITSTLNTLNAIFENNLEYHSHQRQGQLIHALIEAMKRQYAIIYAHKYHHEPLPQLYLNLIQQFITEYHSQRMTYNNHENHITYTNKH